VIAVKGHNNEVLEERDLSEQKLGDAILMAVHAERFDLAHCLADLRRIQDS